MKRILIGAALAVAGIVGVAGASPVSAEDHDVPVQVDDKVCDGTHIPGGNKTSIPVTAPEGMLISGYCVKAGSIQQGLGPEYVDFGDDPVKSFTITYTKSETIKEISHYVVFYVEAPAPQAISPEKPKPIPADCAAAGSVQVLENTNAVEYEYVTVGDVTTVTVTAKTGYVLTGDTGPWMYTNAPQVTGGTCVASNPPPADPVTPATPAAPAPAPAVGSTGGTVTEATPVAESAGPVPAQAAPTQALPATGTSSWVLAFIAMTLVLLGSGFVSFSRRLS